MSARQYPPDYCTAAEMAYLLSMGETTFRGHVAAEIFPEGIQIGGKTLWSRQEVYDALEAHAKGGLVSPPISDDILGAARGKTKEKQRAAA